MPRRNEKMRYPARPGGLHLATSGDTRRPNRPARCLPMKETPYEIPKEDTYPDGRKVVTWTSATRIMNWLDCHRKWWFSTVKYPDSEEDKPYFALGTEVHRQIEHYLNTGDPPNPRQHRPLCDDGTPNIEYEAACIAEAGMRTWYNKQGEPNPAPLPYLREKLRAGVAGAEVNFRIPPGILGPLMLQGQADFLCKDPWMVFDHKTTKDLNAPWHQDEDELGTNVQLLTYAALAFGDIKPRVVVAHIRYSTKPPYQCEVVSTSVSRERLTAHVEDLKGWIASMARDAQKSDPDDVAYSAATCHKYGGCPHKSKCSLHTVKAESGYDLNARGKPMPIPKKKPAAPSVPAFTGTIAMLACLMLDTAFDNMDRDLPLVELADTLGASPAQLAEAVQLGQDNFDDLWVIKDGLLMIYEIDAEGVDGVKAALQEIDMGAEGINPPDAVSPEEELPPEVGEMTREQLIARLNEIEEEIGSAAFMAVANSLGMSRPRKAGDAKLVALINALEAQNAPMPPVVAAKAPPAVAGQTDKRGAAPEHQGPLLSALAVVTANPTVTAALSKILGAELTEGTVFIVNCVR